jgi:hypothetical protein
VVSFPNGTRKHVNAEGRATVMFTQGDVKHTYPDKRIEYFYAGQALSFRWRNMNVFIV